MPGGGGGVERVRVDVLWSRSRDAADERDASL